MATKPALTRKSPIEDRAPAIIRILSKTYPDAHVALNFTNPLECLVATILSAQCTDAKVNKVTATLFVKYRTAEDYLAVPEDELKADIKPTGFFNQKATSIRAACDRIVTVYDGKVPDTMEDLQTLRGVARKTANIVMGNAFGTVEGIAVDTHVRRLAQPPGVQRGVRSGQDRAGSDAVGPAEAVVRLHLRADRSRSRDLPGEEAEVRRVPGERSVPVELGVKRDAVRQPTLTSSPASSSAGADPPPTAPAAAASRRRCRRTSRRSSSPMPPHTPASWQESSDHSRQWARTGHSWQTAMARRVCSTAGPVLPIGKNSSGSSPMHLACWIHHISAGSRLNFGSIIVSPFDERGRVRLERGGA